MPAHQPVNARPTLIPVALLLCLLPSRVAAQEPRANLGLPAAGALGVFAGRAWMERDGSGAEGGALLDLGWFRGRSMRLQAEASLLRAGVTETVTVLGEDTTFTGHYYDLSVSATAVLLHGGTGSRVAPYLLAGISVHALSSSLSGPLTQRYNANRFGSTIGAGVRLRTGGSGRQGAFIEARRVLADEVNRTTLRAGWLAFLGDPAGPRR